MVSNVLRVLEKGYSLHSLPIRAICSGFSGENPGREGVRKELYENFLRF